MSHVTSQTHLFIFRTNSGYDRASLSLKFDLGLKVDQLSPKLPSFPEAVIGRVGTEDQE